MNNTNISKEGLPDQGGRILRSRREGVTVPGTLPSSSKDGLPTVCSAGAVEENTSAMTIEGITLTREEEKKREAEGMPSIPVSSSWEEQLQRHSSRSSSRESGYKPGPASTSQEGNDSRSGSRSGSRSRRGSSASEESTRTRSTDAEIGRKARRELIIDLMRLKNRPRSPLNMPEPSDEEGIIKMEDDEKMYYQSANESEEMDQDGTRKETRKRKRKQESGKQGGPLTAEEYVGLAEAKRALNEQKQKELEIDREKQIRRMSRDELLTNMKLDLENAIDEMKQGPTADLVSRGREQLTEVLRVAKISKNLKGECVKYLKNAAVEASAVLEVLRTRADCPTDSDIPRQLWSMKEELKKCKADAAKARKEADELRTVVKELKELCGGKRSERRRTIVSDSDSSSPSPTRALRGTTKRHTKDSTDKGKKKEEVSPLDTEPMEIEETTKSPPSILQEKKGKKEKVVLPPREQWPPAIRPPIQGKVKILEDQVLVGHRVKLMAKGIDKGEGKGKPAESKDTVPADAKARQTTQGLKEIMAQAMPMLENWLKGQLEKMGLEQHNEERVSAKESFSPTRKDGKMDLVKATAEKVKEPSRKKSSEGKSEPGTTTWAKVLGRKEKKKGNAVRTGNATKARQNTQPAKQRQQQQQIQGSQNTAARQGPGQRNEGGGGGGTTRRSRPPRTAAVTLSCPPEQFAAAMKVARGSIKLEDLGIKALRPRKAATGAIILEIPGPNGGEKAAVLKEKMAEALKEMKGVRVARPIKMAELRLKDVLESVDINEVKETISTLGECKVEEVKTGPVRGSPNGLGTLWVQCPMSAANKIAAMGRIRVGWTSSRVEMLAQRQLQCFRCLQKGHVQNSCKSTIDRSGLCYRCGEGGHLAKSCRNAPSCVLCRESKRPHNHRVGGKACKAPRATGSQTSKEERRGTTSTIPMEVEEAITPSSDSQKMDGTTESMEIELTPETAKQTPMEKRSPSDSKGAGTPTKTSHSPQ